MKAELKRRGKTGAKGAKRRVEKLAAAQTESIARIRGNEMMEFWGLAGHTETSLRLYFIKNKPPSR